MGPPQGHADTSILAPGPMQGFQGAQGGHQAPYTALLREVRSTSQPVGDNCPGGHWPCTPLPS